MLQSMTRQQLISVLSKHDLSVKGNKRTLIRRIKDSKLRLTKKFSISADIDLHVKRKDGQRFKLKGLEAELEKAFGIRNRVSENEDLIKLEMASKEFYQQSDLVQCLRHKNVLVNHKICNFCSYREVCSDEEFRMYSNTQDYFFEWAANSNVENDIRLIEGWLSSRTENDTSLFKSQRNLFSNKVDPFKPGFGIGVEEGYYISPVSDLSYGTDTSDFLWSHIFSSQILNRTLTLFEAIYLNSSVLMDIVNQSNLYSKGSFEESFPTVGQTISFFEKSLNLRDLLVRHKVNKSRMHEALLDKALLGNDNQKLSQKDPFLSKLIISSSLHFKSGLFDERSELFHHFDNKSSFEEHLLDLWIEVATCIIDYDTFDEMQELFSPRTQAQIFYPSSRTYQEQSFRLPEEHRIIRMVEIESLSQPWVMSTHKIEFTSAAQQNALSNNSIPLDWLDFEWSIPKHVKQELKNAPRLYEPSLWPKTRSRGGCTQLNIFQPREFYSALAMNTLMGKFQDSTGDVQQRKYHERFRNLLHDLFFKLTEDENIQQVDSLLYLQEFYNEFAHPKYKRMKPLTVLRQISEKKFNVIDMDKSMFRFIQFDEIETPSGKYIESITIQSPEYQTLDRSLGEDANATDGFGHSGSYKEYGSLLWEFQRTAEFNDDGILIYENNGRWKLCQQRGRETKFQTQKQQLFEDLLSWEPDSEKKEQFESQNIFLSREVCKFLDEKSDQAYDLISRIIFTLNQEGVYHCPFLLFRTELATLPNIQSILSIRELVNYENIGICLGVPHDTISKSLSPNFLHVGALN